MLLAGAILNLKKANCGKSVKSVRKTSLVHMCEIEAESNWFEINGFVCGGVLRFWLFFGNAPVHRYFLP
jgi:hypothetical protein